MNQHESIEPELCFIDSKQSARSEPQVADRSL